MLENLVSTFPYMVGYLALLFFLAALVGLWIWWEDRRSGDPMESDDALMVVMVPCSCDELDCPDRGVTMVLPPGHVCGSMCRPTMHLVPSAEVSFPMPFNMDENQP